MSGAPPARAYLTPQNGRRRPGREPGGWWWGFTSPRHFFFFNYFFYFFLSFFNQLPFPEAEGGNSVLKCPARRRFKAAVEGCCGVTRKEWEEAGKI